MLIGIIAYYYTAVGIIYLIYQFLQLYMDKRFFVFEWKIENGNTLFHTLIKIAEFLVGILSAYKFNALRMHK